MIIKDFVFYFYSDQLYFSEDEIIDMCFEVCSKMNRMCRKLEKSNKSRYTWDVIDQKVIEKMDSIKGLSEFHYRAIIKKVTP